MSSSRKRSRNARSPSPTRASSSRRTPNRPNIATLTRRAANKFLGLTFEDPITLQRVGRSRGIVLNRQMYDRRSLRQLINRGNTRVPHSRRQLTEAEINGIMLDPEFVDRNASKVAGLLTRFFKHARKRPMHGHRSYPSVHLHDDVSLRLLAFDPLRVEFWVDWGDDNSHIHKNPGLIQRIEVTVVNGAFKVRKVRQMEPYAKFMFTHAGWGNWLNRNARLYGTIIAKGIKLYNAHPVTQRLDAATRNTNNNYSSNENKNNYNSNYNKPFPYVSAYYPRRSARLTGARA